jgi:hypothetical protein
VYYLTHHPLCLLKLVFGGCHGLFIFISESLSSLLSQLFAPLTYATVKFTKIFGFLLLRPALFLVRLPVFAVLILDSLTRPTAFPPETEPVKYWTGCFRCIAQKIHHIFAVPFSLAHRANNFLEARQNAIAQAWEEGEETPADLPDPREPELCGTGPGKTQTEERLDEVAREADAAQALLSNLKGTDPTNA